MLGEWGGVPRQSPPPLHPAAPSAKRPRMTPDILCIGSVLWDIIGRSPTSMRLGSDVPGRISRLPGGVAMGLNTAMERLSTGKRINSAKDDAAGLAIASRMTSQVRGLSAAMRKAKI